MKLATSLFCFLFLLLPADSWGQSAVLSGSHVEPKATKGTSQGSPSRGHLEVVQSVEASSEVISTLSDSLKCDHDGNLYVDTDQYGVSAIHKLNLKGDRVALFQPRANPERKIDLSVGFALGPNGDLYQLVFPHEITRYVFVYKPDGTYKSSIKLQPGFPWNPSALAVFPQGSLFVSGLEYDHDRNNPVMWPFSGIFSADGSLLEEVKLEDDGTLRDLAAAGDARLTSPTNPSANSAIDFSKMEAADDGNVYLMRWTNPAIFYAVSPGGEVVRRFTVDPGDAGYHPVTMHVSSTRIAVLFAQPQTEEEIVKVVDLEGHEVATYYQPVVNGKPKYGRLSLAFACYTDNPERFTFLSAGDEDKLQFLIAEPR
jgi:hypothetical protein